MYQKGLSVPEIKKYKNPTAHLSFMGKHHITPTLGDKSETFPHEEWDLEMIFTNKVPVPQVGDEITAPEQLDKLPALSGVVDFEGDIWQKGSHEGLWTCRQDKEPSSVVVPEFGPITVVYIPKESPVD